VGAQSLTNHNDNTQRAAVRFLFFLQGKNKYLKKKSQNDGDKS
jgi:hypothetical protein